MSRVNSVAFAPEGRMLAAASPDGIFLWKLANLSMTSETLATDFRAAPDHTARPRARPTARAGPSNRSSPEDASYWLWDCLIILVVLFSVALLLQRNFLMHQASEECLSLLRSWLDRDGIGLLECRMFLIPGVYRLTVEDQQGVQRRGCAR